MVAEHVKVDIERFIGYVELGIDFFEKAGEELVRLKKNDPDIFEAITSEHKWMTKDMLLVFENIGLKKIHPMTLLMPNHVFAKLSEMPYEQQKYLAEGMEVEVVSSSDLRNGYHQNGVRKLLSELTKPEAELVLSRNGVRTPKEQVEVEAKKASTIDFRDPERRGLFQLTYMNGKLWVRESFHKNGSPTTAVLLDKDGKALIELYQRT